MEKFKLIENEVQSQIDKLPVVYKKMQYDITGDKEKYESSSTICVKSIIHKTNKLGAVRFYKNIEIFVI